MTLPVTNPTPEERADAVLRELDALVLTGPSKQQVAQRLRARIALEIREHAEVEVRALAHRFVEGCPS